MVQALTAALSFEDFIATYPERGDRYELIEGQVIPLRPRGQPELIADFLSLQFGLQIQQRQQDWAILLWRWEDRVESMVFPGLELTAKWIFGTGRSEM